MDNPCRLCQFYVKQKDMDKAKVVSQQSEVEYLKGRTPYTDGKITTTRRIVGYCSLRHMGIAEDTINKESCKERAVTAV